MADSESNTTKASTNAPTVSWAFQNTIGSTPPSADQSNVAIEGKTVTHQQVTINELAIPKASHASQSGLFTGDPEKRESAYLAK